MVLPTPAAIANGGVVWPACETDGNGLNTAIEIHIVDDGTMKEADFRKVESDAGTGCWYLCRTVAPGFTFNVTVCGDGTQRIDVLDETFCQPYDYQSVLARDAGNRFAGRIWNGVEDHMARLAEFGIVAGHRRGDYI